MVSGDDLYKVIGVMTLESESPTFSFFPQLN